MLSIEAIAQQYDVEISTVRKWIRGGLLPAFRIGRVVRVSEDDEQEFRRQHTWRGAAGARARSVDGQSRGTARTTTTGAPSFLEALAAVDVSGSDGQSERSDRGSRTRSRAAIVDFPTTETA